MSVKDRSKTLSQDHRFPIALGWMADSYCRSDCQLGWSLFTAQGAITIKAGDKPAFFISR